MRMPRYKLLIFAIVTFLGGLLVGRWTVNPVIHQPAAQQGKQVAPSVDHSGSAFTQAAKLFMSPQKTEIPDSATDENVSQRGQEYRDSVTGLSDEILLVHEAPPDTAVMELEGETRSPEEANAEIALSYAEMGVPRDVIDELFATMPMEEPTPPPLSDY